MNITIMNKNFSPYFLFSLVVVAVYAVSFLFPELALAVDIKKPGFVDTNGEEKIEEAGEELSKYIGYAFGTVLGIAGMMLGFLAVKGKMEEMWEKFQNIIIGVLMFLLSGTVFFAIV